MIQPKQNFVLVKQIEEETTMSGNIIVPDMGKEKPMIGKVIATGPGTYHIGSDLFIVTTTKVDEIVIIPSFGGQKLSYKGEDYIMMKDTDILGSIVE